MRAFPKPARNSQGQSAGIEALDSRYLLAGQLFAGEGPASGGDTVAVVTADFNGDGKTDIATANAGTGASDRRLTVALGRGDGTFQQPTNVQTSLTGTYANLAAMAVADMNADGRPDLVLAASTTGSGAGFQGIILVVKSNGDGTFDSINSTYSTPLAPAAVTIANLDNDSIPDIVVANRNISGGSTSVTVIASKRYTQVATIAVPANLRDVAAADMDGDGKTDLVIAAEYGTKEVPMGTGFMRGNGDGTFAAPVPVSAAGHATVATGDFNGDGVQDIAAGAVYDAGMTVQFGVGDGTFAAPVAYTLGGTAADLVRADLNADGKPDLVAANGFSNSATVLLNDGSGAFTARTIAAGDNATGVVVADLNRDGRLDLAVASRLSNSVSVLPGRGDGTFASSLVTPTTAADAVRPEQAAAGDFDGDGVLDVAVVNANNGTADTTHASLAVRHGNGDGTFAEPQAIYTIDATPNSVVTGDFNGDGRVDIAVSTAFYLNVLLGNGDGTFADPTRSGLSSNTGIVALDADNDGKTDLAVRYSNRVNVLSHFGSGRFSSSVSVDYSGTPAGLATADFNRDGNADLAVADSTSVTVMLGNGDSTFTKQAKVAATNSTSSSSIVGLAAGDLNGDGIPDVAVIYGNTSTNTLGRLYGQTNGTLTYSSTDQSASFAQNVRIADFDGDGRGEIVVAGQSAAYVHGGVDGYSYNPRILTVGSFTTSLAAGDFTGDGRPDLLSTTSRTIMVTPTLPPVTTAVADPAVSLVGGVLTLKSGTVTVDATPGVPNGLTVTTATQITRLAADAVRQVVLSGATLTLNADLGRVTGNAVSASIDSNSTASLTTSQHLAALTVGGSITLAAGGNRVLRVTTLTLNFRGQIDLNDNALVYDNYPFPAQSDLARRLIASARAGGTWTGVGLTSTAAKNNAAGTTTLGYMTATEYKAINGATATFGGETISDTAVVVRYTLYGDADLNQAVDFNDFLLLQNGFGKSYPTFAGGNFNYDAATDFNDFLVLQNHFGKLMPVPAVVAGANSGPAKNPSPPRPATPAQPATRTAALSGIAFDDRNRNGRYDNADRVAAGKTVWLDLDNDGVKDRDEPTAVTDAHGRYAFANLLPGRYRVRRVFATGYGESTPARYVTLKDRQRVSDVTVGSAVKAVPPSSVKR